MHHALSILGREALRIVLPSWCVVCEQELPWRARTASCCASCWSALPRIDAAKCRACALPLSLGEDEGACRPPASSSLLCIPCAADPLPLDWCEAWGLYQGGLERVLHAFKFQKHDFFDRPLAKLLEETLRRRGDIAFDAVTPVPMPRSRRRERGYNQAELLARELSARLDRHLETSLLEARAQRERQSTLRRAARAANVRGTFCATPAAEGKAILIVDDICTTGETLRACASELLRAGASRVCAITVARAV